MYLDLQAREDEHGQDNGEDNDDHVQVERLALFTNLNAPRRAQAGVGGVGWGGGGGRRWR